MQSTIIDEQQQVITRLHMATHHLASSLLNSTQSIYQEWEARLPALRSGALIQDVGLQIQPVNLGQALGSDQTTLLPMVVMPTSSMPQGTWGESEQGCSGDKIANICADLVMTWLSVMYGLVICNCGASPSLYCVWTMAPSDATKIFRLIHSLELSRHRYG